MFTPKFGRRVARDSKAPKIMSAGNQLRATDSNAALELAFFRQRQQITTKATIGVGTRHDGLYKKGKIRVQVILN